MSGDQRYLSPILFTTDFSNATTSESHSFKTADEVGFKENWLQHAIANNPELVLAACRAGGLTTDERWKFWAKEVPAGDAGSIDLLLISESGRVGIVETKLAYNPGARREVVAQVLEYAINLSSIVEKLPKIPIREDGKPFVDKDEVLYRIQDGDYLLIIAGDKLDSRAVKLSDALLGKHLLRAWDLALVEVAVFEHKAASGQKTHLLVPHIQGSIIPVRRQVVKISIQGDRTRIEVTPATPAAVAGWDEEKFFKEVETSRVSAPVRQFAEELRLMPNEYPSVSLAFGRGQTATLTVRRDGQGILTLYPNVPGFLDFNKPAFTRALGPERAEHYLRQLQAMFPEEMKKDYVRVKLQADTISQVLDQTLKLLREVLALP